MRSKSVKRQIGLLATEVATHGGVQSFMQRMSEVLSGVVDENPGFRGYLLSLNDSSDALRQHDAIPADIGLWGAAGSKSGLLVHVLTKVGKTDVLLVGHLGGGPVAYLLKLIGRVRKYYVILHGIEAWKQVSPLKRLAMMGADKIIATTNYTAETCGRQNAIPADRFMVIPLCVDERLVIPSDDFRLNGGFKLLCVARQDTGERLKGFEHIFKALALLRAKHPQLHLNLVGNGSDQARLKSITFDLGVADQVTFWGRLSDTDLAAAYQQCDVFVMPSRKEGFGIVFLEAMKHGKPCIGGNHGGTPEVIDHGRTGYLVNFGNVAVLAQAIERLAEAPELKREMGLAGKKLVESKFSGSQFHASYRGLILVDNISLGM